MGLLTSRYVWAIVLVALIAIFYRSDRFDPESIKGKRVLITGASSGIGEELAYQYSRLGASVLVTARRAELLEQVVVKCRQLGAKQAEYVVGDMARHKDRARIVDVTQAKLGGLDHLILNHAIINLDLWNNSAENMTYLRNAMDVNFLSFVDITSRSMDMLVESKGNIGVVSSVAGGIPNAFNLYYAPTKFAVCGFFPGLRQELVFRNIDVSVTVFMLGSIATETVFELQRTKFPNSQSVPVAVNDTALVIIESVQNRAGDVYYPFNVWYMTTLYGILPRLLDPLILHLTAGSLAA